VPASAFFQPVNSSDLASSFGNNITIAAGSTATIDISADTTITGSLTMVGSVTGTTLNAIGSGNFNTLTLGALNLNADLALGNAVTAFPTANIIVGGNVAGTTASNVTLTLSGNFITGYAVNGSISNGAGGGTVAVTKTGSGTWTWATPTATPGPRLCRRAT